MSDAADLVAVVGELDREIERLDDPDQAAQARAAAATLIPPLGDPSTAGWYDRLLATGRAEPPVSSLDEGLERLYRPPETLATVPRRVAVVGAVARALPERYGPGGDRAELAALALSGPGIVRGAPRVDEGREDEEPTVRDEARALLELLVDRDTLPDLEALRALLATGPGRELANEDLLIAPQPCSTTLEEVTVGGSTRVALALVTNVCVRGVTLEDVAGDGSFMNPANWSSYSYWCAMAPDPDAPAASPVDAARYLEVVALDCAQDDWLRVAVWLDVSALVRRPGRLLRTYVMSEDQGGVVDGLGANGAVDLDEGSITVVGEGDHLRVSTTKRVRFTTGVDHAILAVVACVAGYGALAAVFVVEGTAGMAEDVDCAGPSARFSEAAPAAGSAVDAVLRRRIEAVGRSVEECATAARRSFARVATGGYTAGDLANDTAGYMVRSFRAGTRLVELFAAAMLRPRRGWTSDPVVFQPPGTGPTTVVVPEAMVSPHGDVLPAERVDVVPPSPLAAGVDAFRLAVAGDGLRGTTYLGTVRITDVPTGEHSDLLVDVQIP